MRPCTVVEKLVIAIGEVVWTPETTNMLKRLLNLVGVSISTRLPYTLLSSSEYDQKWSSSSKHNDDCPSVDISSITLYHFLTPLIVANIMGGVIGGVVIRMGQIFNFVAIVDTGLLAVPGSPSPNFFGIHPNDIYILQTIS